MSFNIMHANAGVEPIVDAILRERPDVVCLQETDHPDDNQVPHDIPARIAERLGGFHVVSAATLRLHHDQSCDVAILSRFPLTEPRAHALESGGWVYAVSALVAAGGRPLRFFSVHLHATFKFDLRYAIESSTTRMREIAALADLALRETGDVIMAGDFNASPSMPEYAFLGGALTDFGQQESRPTFPAKAPMLRLDYIFGSGQFRSSDYRALDAQGSDHLPIIAELVRLSDRRPQARPRP